MQSFGVYVFKGMSLLFQLQEKGKRATMTRHGSLKRRGAPRTAGEVEAFLTHAVIEAGAQIVQIKTLHLHV